MLQGANAKEVAAVAAVLAEHKALAEQVAVRSALLRDAMEALCTLMEAKQRSEEAADMAAEVRSLADRVRHSEELLEAHEATLQAYAEVAYDILKEETSRRGPKPGAKAAAAAAMRDKGGRGKGAKLALIVHKLKYKDESAALAAIKRGRQERERQELMDRLRQILRDQGVDPP
jgi:hypothetical protein